MGNFEGQRVVVTGASSGIGAAMAERFAREGATVGICARRADRLAETLARCQEHAPESCMWVTDLAQMSEVDRLAAAALDELGGVDVLVNNAGIPKRRHVSALDADTVEAVMHVNYLSPVRLTLALLPHMLERDSGRVVNISSVAAPLSSPGESAYDASKAALSSFSEAMAADLWFTGVNVTIVYPGLVATELFDIPDNDPIPASITPITTDEFVDEVFRGLEDGALEIYVPGYFKDFATGKAGNVEGFVAGAAEFVRQQQA